MGETPRPWPRPCRFTRILYAPCTSLEGRTLLPHWIEEKLSKPWELDHPNPEEARKREVGSG